MLRALTRFLQRLADPAQLALTFDPTPHTAEEMLRRLRELGLTGIDRIRLTRNRAVMVSFRDGELRVHEGYLAAPEAVHRSIVTFVSGRTRRERVNAQALILGYPVTLGPRPARRMRERTHPEDGATVALLVQWHARYNTMHFAGELRSVPIRVSRRMKSRLGHYTAASPSGSGAEIVISARHLRRHGWEEALHTLLHEMVHQWQDETGHAIDHGAQFRAKARTVGIIAAARRPVRPARSRHAIIAAEPCDFDDLRTTEPHPVPTRIAAAREHAAPITPRSWHPDHG